MKPSAFALIIGLIVQSQSNETWLLPKKFVASPGEKVSIALKAGDSFMGAEVALKKDQIAKLEWRHLKSVTNVKATLASPEQSQLEFAIASPGVHVIAMQTEPGYREYDPSAFNAYLSDYALDDANYYRTKNKLIDTPGKETYVNCMKLLLLTGNSVDDTYKTPVGFALEIMLQENPAALKVGSKVSFKILFEGKPLFGARVKLWNRYQNRTTMQPIFTQQDGVIESHISNPGPWMVSVVKMVKSKDGKADWFSYCSSLTFGVQ